MRAQNAVTGAAGFIGSHPMARLSAAGHTVVGIDSFGDCHLRAFAVATVVAARANCGSSLEVWTCNSVQATQHLAARSRRALAGSV